MGRADTQQYCGEFDNWGAVMSVSTELLCSFELLKPLDSNALKNHIKKGRNKRIQMLNSPVRFPAECLCTTLANRDATARGRLPPKRLRNDDAPERRAPLEIANYHKNTRLSKPTNRACTTQGRVVSPALERAPIAYERMDERDSHEKLQAAFRRQEREED